MIVGELVAKLQKFPQDDPVALSIVEDTYCEHLTIFRNNAYILLSPKVFMSRDGERRLVEEEYIQVMEDGGWKVDPEREIEA